MHRFKTLSMATHTLLSWFSSASFCFIGDRWRLLHSSGRQTGHQNWELKLQNFNGMFVPVPIDARCPTRLPVLQKEYATLKKDHFVMSKQIDFHFCGFQQQSGNRLVTFCKSFRSISYIPGKCGSTVHLMCVCVCLYLLLLGRFLGARRWPCGFKMRLWDQIKSVFSAWKNQNNRTFLRCGLILNVLLLSAFSCVLVSKKTGRSQIIFLLVFFCFLFFILK